MGFLPKTAGVLIMAVVLVVALNGTGCSGETNAGDFHLTLTYRKGDRPAAEKVPGIMEKFWRDFRA